MYYFETNAIRSLGIGLKDFQFKTSHLCLVELLTGISSEKEFSIRKKCLVRIRESKCQIDSMLPEYKLFTAFGFKVKEQSNQIFEETQKLIDQVLELKEYDPLLEHPHLKVLLQYDKNANTGWRNAIDGRILNRRQVYSSQDNLQEFHSRWINKINKTDHLTNYVNFYSGILKSQDVTGDRRNVQQIASSYDGSLNRYLISMGFYVDDRVLNNHLPKKNDYPDINHLMYVNRAEIIITDDKLIHRLHEATDNKQLAMTHKELRMK